MRCLKCNHEISNESRFCSYCGTKVEVVEVQAVPENKRCKSCPGCKKIFDSNHVFCDQCGRLLLERVIEGKELKKFKLMSKYAGEPKVGVAKATGDLIIYDDRIHFIVKMGNAVGAVFGAVGMAVSASKSKKENHDGDVYWMKDIEEVHESRYMGTMPMLVIRMRNQQLYSFSGLSSSAAVTNAVELINEYRLLNLAGNKLQN